ncbi:hypothetical protein GCM10011505_07910 [Tistrella bauzanensis]|uniref:Single Cache domain-containing protein n=1 Tax=Tistrella bauzanensis TaxID=657419 RepID=A0ABQ1IA49_9PROT|nr:cache domain-containing protein [Tistrella bauzanensis]GGB29017.1 hypothetical protein GCM10011505_07910 [Tistrella bauzanensis]
MRRHLPTLLAALALPLMAMTATAAPRLHPGETGHGPADAQAMVARAVAYFDTHGEAAGLAEVTRGPRVFNDGDLYVFVYDLDGTCRAHARRPGQAGSNLRGIRDRNGVAFIQDWIRIARSPAGAGWSRYDYAHEASGRVLEKQAYIQRSGDLLIGVSAFLYPDD